MEVRVGKIVVRMQDGGMVVEGPADFMREGYDEERAIESAVMYMQGGFVSNAAAAVAQAVHQQYAAWRGRVRWWR